MPHVTDFEILPEHLLLLKESSWGADCYRDLNTPTMNLKRPYGNSDILGDIFRILAIQPESSEDDEDVWSEEQEREAAKLHGELWIVLSICTQLGTWETGRYHNKQPYGFEWEKIS